MSGAEVRGRCGLEENSSCDISAKEVQELLDELNAVAEKLRAKIAVDEEKRAALQRNMVLFADDLEDLDELLENQRKLYKQLSLALDETENSLVQLRNASKTFKNECNTITRRDVVDGVANI